MKAPGRSGSFESVRRRGAPRVRVDRRAGGGRGDDEVDERSSSGAGMGGLLRRFGVSAGQRAAEAQARDVAHKVAFEPAAAEACEQLFLVIDLVAGEQPVAALSGRDGDDLDQAVADGRRKGEYGS